MTTLTNYYYSGQGSLYVAQRSTTTGKPLGFTRVGNVPELSLDIQVDKFEHKESESGSRLLDLTLIKEKKGLFKFKLENLTLDNLALYLYGTNTKVSAGTVAAGAEAITVPAGAKAGMRFALANPNVSSVVVKDSTGVTTYVENTDYIVDAKNGVVELLAGDIVTDAASADIVIKPNYSFGAYTNMEALTNANAPERWLRFEGLNTVDNSVVIVDLFRAQFDPLTGYSLINDELASADIAGSLLADPFITAAGQSKLFRQRNVA